MSTRADINLDSKGDPIFVIGNDFPIAYQIVTGPPITVTANVPLNSTVIPVKSLTSSLSLASRIRFGNLVAVLTAPALVGDKTLTVDAINGSLVDQSVGKLIRDITLYNNMEWNIKSAAKDVVPVLSKSLTSGIVKVDAQNGELIVTVVKADTVDNTNLVLIPPGNYVYEMSRTDSGSDTLLAYGNLIIYQK